jgi:hypothetical protein
MQQLKKINYHTIDDIMFLITTSLVIEFFSVTSSLATKVFWNFAYKQKYSYTIYVCTDTMTILNAGAPLCHVNIRLA